MGRESAIRREDKKKKNAFSIVTQKRTFLMYPDTQQEQDAWIKVRCYFRSFFRDN